MYGSMHSNIFEGFNLRRRGSSTGADAKMNIRTNEKQNGGGRIAARAISAGGAVSLGYVGPMSGFGRSLGQETGRSGNASVDVLGHSSGKAKTRTRKGRVSLRSIGEIFSVRNLLMLFFAGLVISAAVILMLFNFETAVVYGNTKYSQKQIESFITRGKLGENTFVMALKYHDRAVKEIPFVDRIDISIINPSTVQVNITEKPLDGCIDCGEYKAYFSKEGIVQAISGRTDEKATVINGLELHKPEIDAPVESENRTGLDNVLKLLATMDRYELHADVIDVDQLGSLTVGFGDVSVGVGKSGYDRKMYKLHQINKYFEGKSGYISMIGSDYTGENIVLSPVEGTSMEKGELKVRLKKDSSGDPGSAETALAAVKTDEDDDTKDDIKAESEDDTGEDTEDELEKDTENASEKESVDGLEEDIENALEDDPEGETEGESEEKKESGEDDSSVKTTNKASAETAEDGKAEPKTASTEKTTAGTTDKTTAKTTRKQAEKDTAKTTEKSADKTTAKTTEKAAEKTTVKTTEKAADKTTVKTTKKTAEKTTVTTTSGRKTLKKKTDEE